MNDESLLIIIIQYFRDLAHAYSPSGHFTEEQKAFLNERYQVEDFSYWDGKIFIADKENIHFHSTKCQGRHDIEFTFKKEKFNIMVFESYLEEEHKKWNEDPFNNKSGLYAYIVNDNLSADDIACEENLYFSQDTALLINNLNLFFKNQLDNLNTEFKARLWITPEFASQFEKNKLSNTISASHDNTHIRI